MDPVVILATDSVSAGPGGEARLQARVRNQGRRVESYVVEVVGRPADFCVVEPRSMSVLPGKEAEITITFRPPVGTSTPTGSLPFAVRVVSEVGSSSSAVAEGRLELTGATGLQAWADATSAAGRWSATYRLLFLNQGNAPARLFIMAQDPSGAVRLIVRDEVLAVPPGAQVDTEIRVKARQPFLRGSVVNRIVTASCQDFAFGAERPVPGQAAPRDDPHHRTFQLTFQQKPVLSKLTLALAALVVAGVIGLGLLRFRGSDEIVLGLANPTVPQGFTATAQGSNAIFLAWQPVPNAAGYDVRLTTPGGELQGPVEVHVDASVHSQLMEGLGPNEQHCYAIVATAPEGADASAPSEFKCAVTEATPTLEPPVDFVATQSSPGVFNLSWQHSLPPGVTFSVYIDSTPNTEGVAGLTTSLDLETRDLAYEATLSVRAVLGDQSSNFSNSQTVTVDATPVGATTVPPSVPVGTPTTLATVPGGGTGGGATTTAPTTSVGTATTLVETPAQEELQDVDTHWVAVLGPVQSATVGPGEDAQRARLATDFAVAPEEVLTFSNRDTEVQDATGALDVEFSDRSAATEFFYVERLDEAAATTLCREDVRCSERVITAAAAPRRSILVLQTVEPDTPLGTVDDLLDQLRTRYGTRDIHVLDAAAWRQFGSDQLLVYATGFADDVARTTFCSTNQLRSCEPVVLAS